MKSWWRLREQGALCGLCQIVGLYEEKDGAINVSSHELLNLWEGLPVTEDSVFSRWATSCCTKFALNIQACYDLFSLGASKISLILSCPVPLSRGFGWLPPSVQPIM